MTKLLQWLLGLGIMVAVWAVVLNGQVFPNPKDEFYLLKLLWPVGLVGVFGIYSLLVISYRVYSFNDCSEAAAELKEQISEAKADLKKKGLKF